MSASPIPASRGATAVTFRRQIEAAEASGASRANMRLKLTLSDAMRLRRDTTLPIADISFAGGFMSFMGVRVEEGAVTVSKLELE